MGQVLSVATNSLLIFDLDGTLVDSLPDVRLSMNEALANIDRRELQPSEVYDMIGKGGSWLAECALAQTGDAGDDEAIKALLGDFLSIYRARPAAVSTLFPNALETLDILRDSGHGLAVCTNKPRPTTEPVLDHFGLTDYFPVVLCGDDIEHRKPDPRHLQQAMAAFDASPAQTVMIGDSENDTIAANRADVASVFVTFGYCNIPLTDLTFDSAIDDLAELPGVITNLLETVAA